MDLMTMRLSFLIVASLVLGVQANTSLAQTIEQMAGQMVHVGFLGDDVSNAGVKTVTRQIAEGKIGGVMYLRTNIKSLDAVTRINAGFKNAAVEFEPFVSIDQEGGQIRRLTNAVGFTEIASAADIAKGSVASAERIYGDMAQRMAAIGFNLNFGPVVDVNINPKNPIIGRYKRSFSSDPQTVVDYAEAFVDGHRSAGVATALKHFPGHGSSRSDTHDGFVDVTADWQDEELLPYREMVSDKKVDMVMVAHIYNARFAGAENVKLPASLSPEWIEGVLRNQIGYKGVVISDDMQMNAVSARFDLHDIVVNSVMAGNDILLFSSGASERSEMGEKVHAILVAEAKNNSDFAQRVAQSYERIIALKTRFGMAKH